MPVREEPWRWPRDLHSFFRQNLPEGYLLNIIREEFGPLLDGTDLSLLAVVGGIGIGRATVIRRKASTLAAELEPDRARKTPLHGRRQHRELRATGAPTRTQRHFRRRTEIPGSSRVDANIPYMLPLRASLRTSRHIIKGSDESTPYLGFKRALLDAGRSRG